MTDYEKLKLAHELAAKLPKSGYIQHYEFKLIDDIITKLQELTQSKPKYDIGQKIWTVDTNGHPYQAQIDDVDNHSDECYFINEERWYSEDEIYPSREALIDAQIEYWQSLKECQHERDGQFHCKTDMGIISTSEPGGLPSGFEHIQKCKKCGEYYK